MLNRIWRYLADTLGKVPILRDLFFYSLAGVGATVADYGAFICLTSGADWGRVPAQMLSRPAGGLVSFLLNKFVTFRLRATQRTHVQFLRFWIVWLACYGLSILSLWAVHFLWPALSPLASKVIADVTVALISFASQRYWTFS